MKGNDEWVLYLLGVVTGIVIGASFVYGFVT